MFNSVRLKSLPHAPSYHRHVTASKLHGSQGLELIGRFSGSLSPLVSSGEVSTIIKVSLPRENWPLWQWWRGSKDLLLSLPWNSFKKQFDLLLNAPPFKSHYFKNSFSCPWRVEKTIRTFQQQLKKYAGHLYRLFPRSLYLFISFVAFQVSQALFKLGTLVCKASYKIH